MKCSKPGQFYGVNNDSLHLDGIILDDSDYLHEYVDWHWHENAYFTFILQGGVIEGNKKAVNECSAGDLLFHHWQDPHYNVGTKKFTRGFHVELKSSWFSSMDIPLNLVEGSRRIADPCLKIVMANIFKESKLKSNVTQLSVDILLAEIFSTLSKKETTQSDKNPLWVKKVEEALHDKNDLQNLSELAIIAGVHPVHLSRSFSKYFKSTLGDYSRGIKLQKAITLMTDDNLSLTEIALECGFADQSHFIRTFKSAYQLTPFQYRKLLVKKAL